MESQLIACKQIEFPKRDGSLRKFSKEFAETLAASIAAEGMYNDIVVRPDPDKPGFYLGIQGQHRHYAVARVLKEESIRAKVIEDMDDAEAEMAMLAENLWRNPLTQAQHALALKKWWEHFRVRNPDRVGKGTAGGEATRRKAEKRRQAKQGQQNDDETRSDGNSAAGEEDGRGTAEKGGNFAEVVAAVTGQSVSSVKRRARVGKTFDEEQLKVFIQCGTSQTDMTAIAKIKDEGKRREIISLIASGMDAAEAIKEVMRDQAPALVKGKGKARDEMKRGQQAGREAKPKLSFASEGEDAESAEEPIGDPAGALDAAPIQGASGVDPSADLAHIFDADQRETLDQMQVSQDERLAIASVGDAAKRAEVADLIARNIEAADAMKQVLGDTAPACDDGASGAEVNAKEAAKEASDLSDDEWFDTYCGEKASNLGDPTLYKAGALLYRRLGEERHAHRKKVKKLLAAAEKAGMVEPYFLFINRYISVSHPKDWYYCDQCQGKGRAADGRKCWKCSGGGYGVKTEKYL